MLDFVEFKFLNRSSDIIGRPPFPNMGFQTQPLRLDPSKERFENADWLCEFIARQIYRPIDVKREKASSSVPARQASNAAKALTVGSIRSPVQPGCVAVGVHASVPLPNRRKA